MIAQRARRAAASSGCRVAAERAGHVVADLGLGGGGTRSVRRSHATRVAPLGESTRLEVGESRELPDGADTVMFPGCHGGVPLAGPGPAPVAVVAAKRGRTGR